MPVINIGTGPNVAQFRDELDPAANGMANFAGALFRAPQIKAQLTQQREQSLFDNMFKVASLFGKGGGSSANPAEALGGLFGKIGMPTEAEIEKIAREQAGLPHGAEFRMGDISKFKDDLENYLATTVGGEFANLSPQELSQRAADMRARGFGPIHLNLDDPNDRALFEQQRQAIAEQRPLAQRGILERDVRARAGIMNDPELQALFAQQGGGAGAGGMNPMIGQLFQQAGQTQPDLFRNATQQTPPVGRESIYGVPLNQVMQFVQTMATRGLTGGTPTEPSLTEQQTVERLAAEQAAAEAAAKEQEKAASAGGGSDAAAPAVDPAEQRRQQALRDLRSTLGF